jgi:hypothetical protein
MRKADEEALAPLLASRPVPSVGLDDNTLRSRGEAVQFNDNGKQLLLDVTKEDLKQAQVSIRRTGRI